MWKCEYVGRHTHTTSGTSSICQPGKYRQYFMQETPESNTVKSNDEHGRATCVVAPLRFAYFWFTVSVVEAPPLRRSFFFAVLTQQIKTILRTYKFSSHSSGGSGARRTFIPVYFMRMEWPLSQQILINGRRLNLNSRADCAGFFQQIYGYSDTRPSGQQQLDWTAMENTGPSEHHART